MADRARRECRCGTPLARDNTGGRCGACARRTRDSAAAGPPAVPAEFWDHPPMRDALASRSASA